MLSILKKVRRKSITFFIDQRQNFIANSKLGKKLGLAFKTNKQVLDLLTTTRCNSMCFDCSQMCRQAPSTERISVAQVKKGLSQAIKANVKYKKIVIAGGESILESNILEILEELRKYRANFSPKTKLVLLTNGRGEKVKELLKKVPQDIEIFSSNKTSSYIPAFISINAAPIDNEKFKNSNFKAGCRMTKHCGISLCANGYYCCSTAAAIDRVMGFNLGRKKLPSAEDKFLDQKEMLCRYCGHFLSCDYKLERGYQSPSWKKAFDKFKKKKPVLDKF